MMKAPLKFSSRYLALMVAALIGASIARGAPASTPQLVTQQAYEIALANREASMAKMISLEKPWLTAPLYAHLQEKLKPSASRNGATDSLGDMFLGRQGPPKSMEIGIVSIIGTGADVDVILIWPGETRKCVVQLIRNFGAWKIEDVSFENGGKLLDLSK